MDNFLEFLYFEKFRIIEIEKSLMAMTPLTSDVAIRRDQSISEVRQQVKLISQIIKKYIESNYIKNN